MLENMKYHALYLLHSALAHRKCECIYVHIKYECSIDLLEFHIGGICSKLFIDFCSSRKANYFLYH